jgi:hypothetical protein
MSEENGKLKVSIDMDDLTFGELEEFELVTGLVMSDAMKQEIVRDKNGRAVPDPDDPKGRPLKEVKMSARAMMGMVYLGLKRDKSELTFDDVRRLRLSDVDFDIQESADNADPTQPVESSESESAKSAPED